MPALGEPAGAAGEVGTGDLLARGAIALIVVHVDIFWLRDDSLDDGENLPA